MCRPFQLVSHRDDFDETWCNFRSLIFMKYDTDRVLRYSTQLLILQRLYCKDYIAKIILQRLYCKDYIAKIIL